MRRRQYRNRASWNQARIGVLVILGWPAAMAQPAPQELIPPPGRLVDVGGHRLHINCTGQGSPTVVLESGAGDFSLVWALVQPSLAQFTRACSYDRAGYAWSDAGPEPRTIAQIVLELHTLLANAGEKGPYVLVGASLGGPIVRVFANTYPKDVSGMVLVDSTHEDGTIFVNDEMLLVRETSQKREIPQVQTTVKMGGATPEPLVMRQTRFKTLVAGNPRSKLPPDLQRIWISARKQDKYKSAVNSEYEFLPEEMEKLHTETAAAPQPLGGKPLIVLTRDHAFDRAVQGKSPDELNGDRQRLQAKLGKLSTNSKFLIVKDTGHEIHLDQPKAVTSAVQEVVQTVKSGGPLKPQEGP